MLFDRNRLQIVRSAFATACIACLSFAAQARPDGDLSWSGQFLARSSENVAPGFTSMSVVPGSREALLQAGQAIVQGLPLSQDLSIDVVMTLIDPFAEDAVIVGVDDQGEKALPRPTVACFSGSAIGHDGSSIFLSVSPWWIYGYAEVDDHFYIISTGPAVDPRTPVVYDPGQISEDDLKIVIPACETDTAGAIADTAMNARHGGSDTRSGPCRIAKIAFESDYELTAIFGGDTAKSTAYIATVTAAMNDIYSRDVNTRMIASYVRVWSTANDPWTTTNSGDRLNEFRSYWASRMFQVPRNLAHFLSGSGLGGGVAWLSVMCNSQYGYAVSGNLAGSFPYPLKDNRGNNWDPYVVAHELGHNFGSPHTHDYVPPIDTCGLGDCTGMINNGTIMSYCHLCTFGVQNIKLKFGDRVNERILQYLQDEAPCELADLPKFVKQPVDTTANLGATAKFTVSTTGPGVVEVNWYHDGVLVPGGPTPTLTITGVTAASAGEYHAVASNLCNAVQSDSAQLHVNCPSDFDGSGFVDLEDFTAFVNAFTAGNISADFDKSGFLDTDDFDAYVHAFESGC